MTATSDRFDALVQKHMVQMAGGMATTQALIDAKLAPEDALATVFEDGLRTFAKELREMEGW